MLATAMTATLFAGCGSDASNADSANSADATASTTEAGDAKTDAAASGSGSVYYLNFKPEQDQQWQDLAAKYTAETGTEVTVITAADGTYEQTLKSEMAKSEAPTLFQVNGPVGLANWKDYCMDLSGSELYSHLTSDDFVLKDGNAVQGIAYVIETYGIIYNKTILNDYCTMDNAVISSVDEINNFATLKAVADDIQSRLDEITTTNRSSIFTSQILPVIRECSHLRQVMKQNLNSVWKRQYSTRMVHGSMVTSQMKRMVIL